MHHWGRAAGRSARKDKIQDNTLALLCSLIRGYAFDEAVPGTVHLQRFYPMLADRRVRVVPPNGSAMCVLVGIVGENLSARAR